jgi:hypothetical protein
MDLTSAVRQRAYQSRLKAGIPIVKAMPVSRPTTRKGRLAGIVADLAGLPDEYKHGRTICPLKAHDMARLSNEETEQYYFEDFRKVYRLPDGCVIHGDKPDVIIHGSRRVGIEMTNFFIQDGSLSESEQRQSRYRTDIVAAAQRLYRAGGGKNDIGLQIGFSGDLITLARKRKIPNEIVGLARSIGSRKNGDIEHRLFRATPELSSVYLVKYENAQWQVSQVQTVGFTSKDRLEAIVRGKEAKANEYQPCDAYWLLIVIDWNDPAQDQEIRLDRIESNIFEKIIIYKTVLEQVVVLK